MAASVPVLLVAGVLPWQRDTMCTRAGCGSVTAAAWAGSPVWALLLLAGLATAGAWVLLLPVRGRAPIGLAVLTAVVAVLAAAGVVVSLDGLVFNRGGLVSFPLPVTETFPVLAVHPGEGLVLALAGLLLQVVAGWSTLRRRNALVCRCARRCAVTSPVLTAARAGSRRGRRGGRPLSSGRDRRHPAGTGADGRRRPAAPAASGPGGLGTVRATADRRRSRRHRARSPARPRPTRGLVHRAAALVPAADVVAAHSGAGLLLPLAAARAGARAAVFVDALLPGRPTSDRFRGFLATLPVTDGRLPRWSDWWGEEAMAELVPDAALRARIVAEQPRLPVAFYDQTVPVPPSWPPPRVAYLQFTAGYDPDAEAARTAGWPVRSRPGEHLDLATHPDETAAALLDLAT